MGKIGVETFPTARDLFSATLLSPGHTLKDGYAWFRGVQLPPEAY